MRFWVLLFEFWKKLRCKDNIGWSEKRMKNDGGTKIIISLCVILYYVFNSRRNNFLFDLNGTIAPHSGVLKILLKKMENMKKTANFKIKK